MLFDWLVTGHVLDVNPAHPVRDPKYGSVAKNWVPNLLGWDVPITAANPFKWRHYPGDIIMWCVRWYLRYPISVAQMGEMARKEVWPSAPVVCGGGCRLTGRSWTSAAGRI